MAQQDEMQAGKKFVMSSSVKLATASAFILIYLTGCSTVMEHVPFVNHYEPAPTKTASDDYNYIIGPGDNLTIFVWRNPELSTSVPVRPDGKFSTPLVEDLVASGKTPSALSREIEVVLGDYIRDPLVTVTVGGFRGEFYEQVRVVGEAAQPLSIPFVKNMTVLDLMVQVGGLTEFAAGNRATIVRTAGSGQQQYRVRLNDLIKDGDISANVDMQPGDILIIPEAWF
ncbi:MAG: polysaccharide export outer membrane protein [Gammaproteobacteria bacterium]|jgi:polysaccharide export outer membrane protein